MLLAKVKLVYVYQEFRQIKELGNEFTDITHILFRGRFPSFSNRVEKTIRMVKGSALCFFLSNESRILEEHVGSENLPTCSFR